MLRQAMTFLNWHLLSVGSCQRAAGWHAVSQLQLTLIREYAQPSAVRSVRKHTNWFKLDGMKSEGWERGMTRLTGKKAKTEKGGEETEGGDKDEEQSEGENRKI